MSSAATTTTKDEKRAKLEAMKAKKKAMQANQGSVTSGAAMRASGTSGTAESTRACGEATIMSPPRVVDGVVQFEAHVTKVQDGGGEGKMLLPTVHGGAAFHPTPLTNEKGDTNLYKWDSNKKERTDERKPVELGDIAITTVMLDGAPKGPADGFISPALFPGCKVSVQTMVACSKFKQGTCVKAKYAKPEEGTDLPSPFTNSPLDLEMPSLAFSNAHNDPGLARRNMMLSTVMGGWSETWLQLPATDATKQSVKTALGNERDALLGKDGVWASSMASVAGDGDAAWKSEAGALVQTMVSSAPFRTEGLCFDATSGPKIMLPIPGLIREQSLGDDSSCGHMFAFLESDTPPAADFFEGKIALNGEDRKYKKQLSAFSCFGSKSNASQWMHLPLAANTMAKGATEAVSIEQPFTLKLPVLDLPVHFGSKHVETIKAVAHTMLPLADKVASFEPNLKNVKENKESNGTWDCRLSTVDLHSALLEHGIQMDVDMACMQFENAPRVQEEQKVVDQFTTQPKNFLACGFVLLNENMDARNTAWLQEHADIMKQMLASLGRPAECEIEMRAVDLRGFESHTAWYEKLEDMGLEDRVGELGDDLATWAVYAVLKIGGPRAELTTADCLSSSGSGSASTSVSQPAGAAKKQKTSAT